MKRRAFTLIELLGTLAVIMIMITVATVSIGGALRKNQIKTNQLKMANMLRATEDYIIKNKIPLAANVPLYFSVNGLVQENILTGDPNDVIKELENIKTNTTFFIEAKKTSKLGKLSLKVVTEKEFLNTTGVPEIDNVVKDTWAIDYRPSTKNNSTTMVTKEKDITTIKFKLAKSEFNPIYSLYINKVEYELKVKKTFYNKSYPVDTVIKSGSTKRIRVNEDGSYSFKINTDINPGIYELTAKINTETNSKIGAKNALTIIIGDSVDKELITEVSSPPTAWVNDSMINVDVWGKREITDEYADVITYYGYRYNTMADYDNKINGVPIGSVGSPIQISANKVSAGKEYGTASFSTSGVYELWFNTKISSARNATSDTAEIKGINEIKTILMLDNIKPTVSIDSSTEGSDTNWAKTRTIGVTLSDANSLIQTKPLEVTDDHKVIFNASNQLVRTKTLSPNQVIDKAGNIAAIRDLNVYVDYQNPSCTTSATNNNWTNQTVRVTGTCSDGTGSGCSGTNPYYDYTTNTNITNGGPGVGGASATVSDKAGNTATCLANQVVKVDKTAPAVPTWRALKSNGTNYDTVNGPWSNLTITWDNFTAPDTGGSQLYQIQYSYNCTGNNWLHLSQNSYPYDNHDWMFCLRAVDNAGNISANSAPAYFRADTTKPVISSASPVNYGSYVRLTVTATDNLTGIAQYSFDGGTTWKTSNYNDYTSGTTAYVRVKDGAGNISTQTDVSIVFDTTGPTFNVAGNPNAWTNQNVTLTIQNASDPSGLHSTPYSFNGGAWQTSASASYSSNQTVTVAVRDVYGNASSQNVTISYIDKTAPSFGSSINNPSNNVWSKQDVTVSWTATDTGSGFAAATNPSTSGPMEFSYDQSTVNPTTIAQPTSNGILSWSSSSPWIVDRNNNLYFRIKDRAGNSSGWISAGIIKIDKTGPTVSNIVNNSNGNWTNQNFSVSWTATDTYNPVTKFDFSYDQSTLNPTGAVAQPPGNTSIWSSSAVWSSERNDTLYFRATDSLGNVGPWSTGTPIKIDKTGPKITVTQTSVSGTTRNYRYTVENDQYNVNLVGGAGYKNVYCIFDGTNTWGSVTNNHCKIGTQEAYPITDVDGNFSLYVTSSNPRWTKWKVNDNLNNSTVIYCTHTTAGQPSCSASTW